MSSPRPRPTSARRRQESTPLEWKNRVCGIRETLDMFVFSFSWRVWSVSVIIVGQNNGKPWLRSGRICGQGTTESSLFRGRCAFGRKAPREDFTVHPRLGRRKWKQSVPRLCKNMRSQIICNTRHYFCSALTSSASAGSMDGAHWPTGWSPYLQKIRDASGGVHRRSKQRRGCHRRARSCTPDST